MKQTAKEELVDSFINEPDKRKKISRMLYEITAAYGKVNYTIDDDELKLLFKSFLGSRNGGLSKAQIKFIQLMQGARFFPKDGMLH